jgi:8-oxo-dGTP pyrophosphatase MutT (NUDIX family)
MRAVGIIIKNNKILLIHHIKDGKEYYVSPGGTIEEG